jgi:hypothetical protein
MTRKSWLSCTDPERMIDFLWEKASERKKRLFACACCRRLWDYWNGVTHTNREAATTHRRWVRALRNAVQVAERYADAQATGAELEQATSVAGSGDAVAFAFIDCATGGLPGGTTNALRDVASLAVSGMWEVGEQEGTAETAAQAHLLREIFGNPFLPVTFSPEWRTNTAVSLARQMDESRDFSAMSILADALQDCDCNSADILNHCRGAGPHVRGCWVVDLVLGKE